MVWVRSGTSIEKIKIFYSLCNTSGPDLARMDKNSSVVKDLGKNWARSGTSSFSACHGMPDEILVWAR